MKPLALVLATIAIIAFAASRPPQLQSSDGASVAEVAQLAERRLRDTSPEAAGSNPALGPLVPFSEGAAGRLLVAPSPRQPSDGGGVWGTPPPTDAADVRSGWATWCAPTVRHCQRWGGDAMLGAVRSFRWGDEPYAVQVCSFDGGRTNCVLVTVVSFCACGARRGGPTLIDLSPAAFRSLAPLGRGVIRVQVDGIRR